MVICRRENVTSKNRVAGRSRRLSGNSGSGGGGGGGGRESTRPAATSAPTSQQSETLGSGAERASK